MASKIYISAVRFTMLLHPPTKDLSCLLTYQVSIAPFSSAIQYHPNPLVGAHAVLCVEPFNHDILLPQNYACAQLQFDCGA
jgi:hypothetical protein